MSVVAESPCPVWEDEEAGTFYLFRSTWSMPSACIERLLLSCGSLVSGERRVRKEQARHAPPNVSWLLFIFSSQPIPAESVQPMLVLKGHGQEGDTSSFLLDPLHLNKITLHRGGSVVRRHLERQVLATPEGFREA